MGGFCHIIKKHSFHPGVVTMPWVQYNSVILLKELSKYMQNWRRNNSLSLGQARDPKSRVVAVPTVLKTVINLASIPAQRWARLRQD